MNIIELEIGTESLINTALFYFEIMGLKVTRAEDSVSIIAGRTILKFRKAHHQNLIYHLTFNIPVTRSKKHFSGQEINYH